MCWSDTCCADVYEPAADVAAAAADDDDDEEDEEEEEEGDDSDEATGPLLRATPSVKSKTDSNAAQGESTSHVLDAFTITLWFIRSSL